MMIQVEASIKLSVLAKLPKGRTILGTESIRNPYIFSAEDPEVIDTYIVLWTDRITGLRKANFSMDGEYLGDYII